MSKTTAKSYYHLALNSIEELNWIEAFDHLSKAIEYDANNGSYYFKRGIAYVELEQYVNAEKDLLQAFSLKVHDIDLYIYLSKIYIEAENYTEAKKYLQIAYSLAEDNLLVLALMGTVFTKEDDCEQAKLCFEEIKKQLSKESPDLIKIDKTYAEIYTLKADFLRFGNCQDNSYLSNLSASIAYSQALKHYENYYPALVALAELYLDDIKNMPIYSFSSSTFQRSYLPTKKVHKFDNIDHCIDYAEKARKIKPSELLPLTILKRAYKEKKDGKKLEEIEMNISQIQSIDKQHTTKSNLPMTTNTLKIAILTALTEEYNAVKAHLQDIGKLIIKGQFYQKGIFTKDDIEIAEVVVKKIGQKNVNASKKTQEIIGLFEDRYFDAIFFVGIAGARKDFKVGDVICPRIVLSYEGSKALEKRDNARPDSKDLTPDLLEFTDEANATGDWKAFLLDSINEIIEAVKTKSKINAKDEITTNNEYDYLSIDNLVADTGIIASGDSVVEHFNSSVGELLTKSYDNAQVIEMEGFGFAEAAKNQNKVTEIPYVGIVRGVSDKIKKMKEEDNAIDYNPNNRPDEVKQLASATAAAFTYYLIYKIFESKKNS